MRDYNKLPDFEELKELEKNPALFLATKMEYNSFYYPSSSNVFIIDPIAYETVTHVGQIITDTLVKHLANEQTGNCETLC
jgi:hypothetical protein